MSIPPSSDGDPARLGPEAGEEGSTGGWADEPDRWQEADRQWREKWEEDEEPLDPPSDAYRPEKTSAKAVAGSYQKGMQEAGPYLTLGIQVAGGMVMFVGAGWAVDRWLETSPWGIILGAVLGFIGVMTLVVRLARDGT